MHGAINNRFDRPPDPTPEQREFIENVRARVQGVADFVHATVPVAARREAVYEALADVLVTAVQAARCVQAEPRPAGVMRVVGDRLVVTAPGGKVMFEHPLSGHWGTSTPSRAAIQGDISAAWLGALGREPRDDGDDDFTIVLTPEQAAGVARSPEYKEYIRSGVDAIAQITDQNNPNRRYSLAPFLYGFPVRVTRE